MIGTNTYMGIAVLIAGGILLPLSIAIWWIKTKKENVSTLVIGAMTWFFFAIVLETIPKAILLNPSLSIGKAVLNNVVLFVLIGSLLAGVFEETGRWLAYKTVLKNRTNKETSITYGIGHGGFEAMYILVVTGIQYLIYASMINAGTFQEAIDQAVASGVDPSTVESLPQQLMSITPATSLLAIGERVFAILLHIGLSILVFYAVRRSKKSMYFLAILLHTLFDIPAAMYQAGALNIVVTEIIFAIYSVVFIVVVYQRLYKKDEIQYADTEQ